MIADAIAQAQNPDKPSPLLVAVGMVHVVASGVGVTQMETDRAVVDVGIVPDPQQPAQQLQREHRPGSRCAIEIEI